MTETKYYLDLEGLTEIILQLSEIIQSKTSNLVSQEAINKFATIKTILDTNLSIGLNEDGSHIKTEGKFTDKAETIAEEISALDTELYSLKEAVDASVNINDLSLVAVTGDYNDLSNKPVIPSVGDAEIEIQKNGTKINSFTTNQSGSKVNINITVPTGTAADKNIPSSGDASSTEVVMGNDTRLSDSRPASDVYSWAKAENKPSYEKGEIGLENVTNDAQVKRTEMGVASGVATLDSAGKVPSSQLPSYVDDILEYDTLSAFPETGEGGKIYVDKSSNTSWRWSGSTYTQIKGDLTIGTTSGTAADGKIVNDHINNVNNPHGVTKEQVGLGSVVNTGDSATPVSGGTTKFTTGGAYTELAKKVDKVSGKELSTNDYTTDEKNKLNGIASGAEVNQNAFSNVDVKVGNTTTTVAANSKTGTVALIQGDNVTLTADTTNNTITIAATDTGGFNKLTNSTDNTKVGLVNSLSQYYDTNIGKGAVIEGDGYEYGGTTYNIVASGNYSHAEGYSTTASGNYGSHAEGSLTTASGSYSHAEGWKTQASGASSHAEGNDTKANSMYSHAEGDNTKADGNSSHAEGSWTTATGKSSHAEGDSTKAVGNYSHVEGQGTTANSMYSHAEGDNTIASGQSSHAEGQGTKAVGDYGSHAEGQSTQANGWCAHAEGQSTQAIGYYSHAEGQSTIASGQYCAHAEGQGTIASNNSEHASGQYNISSKASTTFGDSGNTLFSVGNGIYNNPRHNAFEIRQNGDIYISKGGTITSPMIKLQDNIGGGFNELINSTDNTKVGLVNKLSQYYDTNIGKGAVIEGNGYEYNGTTYNIVASGSNSHVEGRATQASGDYSHAEGNHTQTNNQSEHASGLYNVSSNASTTFGDSGNTLFSVGNGTDTTLRHNAFEIRQNGDIYINDKSGNTINLQDEIAKNATDIAVNTTNITTLATKVTTNEIEIANNKAAIETNAAAIANNKAAINDLNGRLTNKADKAITLSGYGITNAYTKNEIDNMIGNIETLLDAI